MGGLRHRIGFRGAVLIAFGGLDLVYGASLAVADAQTRATPLYRYAAHSAPLPAWGVLWMLVGAVCLAQAPMREDWAAYGAAQLIKALWAAVAVAGWLSGQVPRGYVSAVVWLFGASIVAICSRWPEPGRQ